MNTEDFVTYEQALALKKLGFRWPLNWYYIDNKSLIYDTYTDDFNVSKCYASAPTLAQAQKWLRKEKNVDIIVTLEDDTVAPYQVEIYINKECVSPRWENGFFTQFEEALSAGITECLKLLENE